jgi:predicted GH43/DUF377 family glycosyl hydrolase
MYHNPWKLLAGGYFIDSFAPEASPPPLRVSDRRPNAKLPDMPSSTSPTGVNVSLKEMRRIHEQVRTPFKYGIILHPPAGKVVDCPSVFRFGDAWYMVYVQADTKIGYETMLARSENLLEWKALGAILPFGDHGWDQWQADGGISLVDHNWGGSCAPASFQGRYWMSYLGGAKQGYEPDPLSIGLAWSKHPDKPEPWTRLDSNPALSPNQPDARLFEKKTLYKSTIIHDQSEMLHHPFVMFYNGKQEGKHATERIGMAVSQDMVHWSRFGAGPVIDNGERGISGDPQIVRIGDLWVMFYFGHVWRPKAFDTFAVSRDLVHWTRWEGENLVEPSEPWDQTFAHKPWVLKWEGTVYHFYCAVGDQGRAIALASSRDLRA